MARPVQQKLRSTARRIRRVAEAIGTQAEVAKVAGVSLAQLKNYVAAKSEAPPHVLAALAVASGYCLEWIIAGVGPERCGLPMPRGVRPGTSAVLDEISRSPSALERLHPDATRVAVESLAKEYAAAAQDPSRTRLPSDVVIATKQLAGDLGSIAEAVSRRVTTALASEGRTLHLMRFSLTFATVVPKLLLRLHEGAADKLSDDARAIVVSDVCLALQRVECSDDDFIIVASRIADFVAPALVDAFEMLARAASDTASTAATSLGGSAAASHALVMAALETQAAVVRGVAFEYELSMARDAAIRARQDAFADRVRAALREKGVSSEQASSVLATLPRLPHDKSIPTDAQAEELLALIGSLPSEDKSKKKGRDGA